MRRRPQNPEKAAISFSSLKAAQAGDVGLVLSGGGARAAYQVGALKALEPYLDQRTHPISVIIGSSIGAINGLIFAACLKSGYSVATDELVSLWVERTFRNTFAGSASRAFLRSIKIALLQYLSPGPKASNTSIFDPSPLVQRVDSIIEKYGGLTPENRAPQLKSVAVMTTIEGQERKPLIFVSTHKRIDPETLRGASFQVCYVESLHAKHGFASAALPAVLPPVELDTDAGKVSLVDGGISQNTPVDPAARMGAERVILIDISGRDWWHNRFGEPHDKRPEWEVPAGPETFCMRPPETFIVRCQSALGPLLKSCTAGSTSKFMAACGATWPLFTLLKKKLGEEVAYETMSYVALDPDYLQGLIDRGFNETRKLLQNRSEIEFKTRDPHELEASASTSLSSLISGQRP
ncbi:MAG: patatin-like phospholipase family protein [Oligoflexia bacterium]|nr:patatin-like phospholipase family protein [Oligoflexia bacterium]